MITFLNFPQKSRAYDDYFPWTFMEIPSYVLKHSKNSLVTFWNITATFYV